MNNTIFVVCPIGDENSNVRKRSDKFFEHFILPISQAHSINATRADLLNNPTKITDDVIKYLNHSRVVIVDITDINPNVFFELGYRYKSGKPFIIVKHIDDKSNIPFDISSIRVFPYSFDIETIDTMRNNISEAISNIDTSNTTVLSSGPFGNLNVTPYESEDGVKGFVFTTSMSEKE